MLKLWSIDASMLEATLLPFMEQIWTLVSPSAKTAGSGDILCFCIRIKDLNVSNAMVHTRANTTDTLCGAANWTSKLTHLDLKWSKRNYVPIFSNVLIVRVILKPTLTCALSGNTSSIENGIQRNIKKSDLTETS